MIVREGPDTVAAFFAEPVMGAGGVIVPPATYFDRIQPILKKYEVLFIVDEVICAFARTGNMFGTQTFGISSGTSNCVESSGTQGARTFIEGNREALAKDAARGSGETIVTLSAVAGCKDAKAVGAVLQKRFAQLFPGEKTAVDQVSENVIKELRSNSSLACGKIG